MRQHARLILCVALALGVTSPKAGAQQDLFTYSAALSSAVGRGAVGAIAFDYGGATLAAGTEDGTIAVLDPSGTRPIRTFRVRRAVVALAFDREGKMLVVGTEGAGASLIDLEAGTTTALGSGRGTVRSVAVSPRGDVAAIPEPDGSIGFWSLRTREQTGRLTRAASGEVRVLIFRERGERILVGDAERRFAEWDVAGARQIRQFAESEPFMMGVTASHAGDWLIVGTENRQLTGYRGGLGAVRSGGGAAYIDRIKIYNVATGIADKTIENILVEPRRLSVSADYKVIAVAERDVRRSAVGLWDVERGVRIAEVPVADGVTDVAFSPDGRWLAAGTEKGVLQLYSTKGVAPRLAYTGNLTGRKFVVTSPRTPLVRPSRNLRFAVLDLDDNGVGVQVASAIADQLANRLAANPGVRLVERRRMNLLLQEQDLQQSGRTDAASAVQLARILNVRKVVLGAVARLGTTMTITAQLVDVETGQIDGIREVQCSACALEDLSEAVAEMAQILVAPAEQAVDPVDPPSIELVRTEVSDSVGGTHALIRGTVSYSRPLESMELVVNGSPISASRALALAGSKETKIPPDRRSFTFVQQVPIDRPSNLIAVRAVGADGNDEQQYVVVKRASTAAARQAPPTPRLSLGEVLDALAAGSSVSALATLARTAGVDFPLSSDNVAQLRALGANEVLLTALRGAGARPQLRLDPPSDKFRREVPQLRGEQRGSVGHPHDPDWGQQGVRETIYQDHLVPQLRKDR